MFFLYDISPSSAEAISTWSNFALIIALVVGVIATVGVAASASIKERNWEILRIAADERIALNEKATEEARERAALAEARAAEANTRNLALEAAIAPRTLEQHTSVEALRAFAGYKFFIASSGDTEARRTAAQIRFILLQAGWIRYEGDKAPPIRTNIPDGISVRSGVPDPMPPGVFATSFSAEFALVDALTRAGAQANVSWTVRGWPIDFILVEVGLKPIAATLLEPRTESVTVQGNMVFE